MWDVLNRAGLIAIALAATWLAVGCGGTSRRGDAGSEHPPDVASESAPDLAPDAAADLASDAASDVAIDVATDSMPDLVDAVPDRAPDGPEDSGLEAPPVNVCGDPSPRQVWTSELFVDPVHSVGVFSESDVWRGDDKALWHWNGGSWTSVLTQTSGYDFSAILPFATNDVWVLGDKHVKHWDGQTWSDRTPATPRPAFGLWGRATNDVWALSYAPGIVADTTTAFHWDGVAWKERPFPGPPATSGDTFMLTTLWPSASDDVWAAGYVLRQSPSEFDALVLHWDGTQWSESGSWHAVERANLQFTGIGAATPGDVWAMAYGRPGTMWHLVGGIWTQTVNLPSRKDIAESFRWIFWSGCPGALWMAANGHVGRLAAGTWTFTKMPSYQIYGIGGLGNMLWLPGFSNDTLNGAILRNRPDGPAVCRNARLDSDEQCDPPDFIECSGNCLILK
jgi:hypothetical protein